MKQLGRSVGVKNVSDYIIIGAGSAGCVLANRLSQNMKDTVHLIEAGKSDIGHWDSWKIQMPSALTYNLGDQKYNWGYKTERQRELKGRTLDWPRGKCLGGSSSLNAMVYMRGNAMDFNRWAEQGAIGWDYSRVLPYFQKSTCHELGGDDYRGANGPLKVTRGRTNNPLYDQFIEGGIQQGYQFTSDINGYQQEGFGYKDMTVYRGQRWSTANAYLRQAETRHNLYISKQSMARRLLWEQQRNKQPRCIGVEIQNNKGEYQQYYANKEVILSGGAINSPQLLQLSGVGDPAHLQPLDIEVVIDNKEVGQNLQDHIEVYMQYKCLEPITLYKYGSFTTHPYTKTMAGLEWFMYQSGICASNHFESGGFIRSDKGIQYPDIQYHFMPAAVHGQLTFRPFEAFQMHVGTLRGHSKGCVQITSKDPLQHPLIQPNILSAQQDRTDMLKAIQLTLEMMNSSSWNKYRGQPLNFSYQQLSNEEGIMDWMEDQVESSYHPSCTLAMGRVVDQQGRLKGANALRVVDASIMPSIVSSNLNASVVMLAEKIADNIRGVRPLLPSAATNYINPNWKTSQK